LKRLGGYGEICPLFGPLILQNLPRPSSPWHGLFPVPVVFTSLIDGIQGQGRALLQEYIGYRVGKKLYNRLVVR
jgi:hypothetical protein